MPTETLAQAARLKLNLESLTNNVSNEPRSKRFSSLDQAILKQIWHQTSLYIHQQLKSSRSVYLPTLGYFFVNRDLQDSYPFTFLPSHTWDKFTNTKVTKTMQVKTAVTETLNFSIISREAGISRDKIEIGLKDLLFYLVNLLKRGQSVVQLSFPKVGYLYVGLRSVKFRFNKSLENDIRQVPQNAEFDSTGDKSFPQLNTDDSVQDINSQTSCQEENEGDSGQEARLERPDNDEANTESLQSNESSAANAAEGKKPEMQKAEVQHLWELSFLDSIRNGNTSGGFHLPPIQMKSECWSERKPRLSAGDKLDSYSRLSTASNALDDDGEYAFLFGLRSSKDFHTHQHSGNRLWSNIKCPICLQFSGALVDKKDEIKKREIEQDRLLLNLSLEVDREFINRKKELEMESFKESSEIARFNRQQALEQSRVRKEDQKPKPMGDLLETRIRPRSRRSINRQNANDILEQMADKQRAMDNERDEKVKRDKFINNFYRKETKRQEYEACLEKHRRVTEHRAGLDAQVFEERTRPKEPEIEMENRFANDESPLFSAQRERAKRLHAEQLEILSQKREFEAQTKELQKSSNANRLKAFKGKVDQDLEYLRKQKYEARKSLEKYWNKQVEFAKVHNPYLN